jgi:hypothetical protein
LPARASPDCYRGCRDLLQRLFKLIKMRVVLRCPNLARLRHADEQAECLLIGVDRKWPTCAQNVSEISEALRDFGDFEGARAPRSRRAFVIQLKNRIFLYGGSRVITGPLLAT